MSLALIIKGFSGPPEAISELLGLTPTLTSVAGELSPAGRPYRQGWWYLKIEGAALHPRGHFDALDALLKAVDGKQALFTELRSIEPAASVRIDGGLHFSSDEQAGVFLDVRQMRILADCGIDWGVDFYVEGNHERP